MDDTPTAELVMRLRAATGLPVMKCKQWLEKQDESQREQFVRDYENGKPLEVRYADPNPTVR